MKLAFLRNFRLTENLPIRYARRQEKNRRTEKSKRCEVCHRNQRKLPFRTIKRIEGNFLATLELPARLQQRSPGSLSRPFGGDAQDKSEVSWASTRDGPSSLHPSRTNCSRWRIPSLFARRQRMEPTIRGFAWRFSEGKLCSAETTDLSAR